MGRNQTRRAEMALRAHALKYPEAYEEFPWGERALKVRRKVFVFMFGSDDGLSITVKLPSSGEEALALPFAQAAGYGLGRSGWVTAQFPASERPPVALLEDWIDESYRAVAPKALVAALPEPSRGPT